MFTTPGPTLHSTLPARALLGRLLTVRVASIAGWAAGIAWLQAGLGIPMPIPPMAAVLALMTLFSLTTAWRLRQKAVATPPECLAHLLADLTAFAVLVFFSGGVTNPFVSLMLLPVVIAAVSLSPRAVWLTATVAAAYYGLLLFYFQPLAVADPVAAYGMHLAGMWANFLVSAGLIAFFITRVQAGLRARDRALADLRERQLRDERIVALGTQAALAAHELATPLATIQTTAHELARDFANDPEISPSCRLIERQTQACKRILTRLSARAADTAASAQPVDAWIESLIERWQLVRPDARLAPLRIDGARPFVPPDGLESALLNVLNNAADVSSETIDLHAAIGNDTLTIEVADRGPGLTTEQHARAGRTPLRSPAGWGMGLALTQATLERLGGRLVLAPREDGGTRVTISVPIESVA